VRDDLATVDRQALAVRRARRPSAFDVIYLRSCMLSRTPVLCHSQRKKLI
jgi:hypothetical protein